MFADSSVELEIYRGHVRSCNDVATSYINKYLSSSPRDPDDESLSESSDGPELPADRLPPLSIISNRTLAPIQGFKRKMMDSASVHLLIRNYDLY